MYSYVYTLQSPSRNSPSGAITPIKTFFSRLKTVSELIDFGAFWCFCHFFVSSLPHWQDISLWGLFSPEETKKNSCWGRDQVNREGGTQGVMPVLVKNRRTLSAGRAGVLIITHREMGKCVKRVFKKIHWSQTQPLTTPPTSTLTQMSS